MGLNLCEFASQMSELQRLFKTKENNVPTSANVAKVFIGGYYGLHRKTKVTFIVSSLRHHHLLAFHHVETATSGRNATP